MKPDHKQPLMPREAELRAPEVRVAELLAPSGSLSCMKAAISGGADAVYFGGTAFNARKSAANFTKEDIEEGIRLCRLHGVRTHLTVNTSIKEKEFPQLIDFLEETVPLGVDALIVQDPGVMLYLREHFPDVEIHASTQMAVSSLDGAKLMESMGISRVVLARELTLSEIEKIRRGTKLSLEVFVHGALCYGVSGRCLMSSFHGGRSGNRGACAQPCRLWYECQSMEEGLNARGKDSQRSAGERTAEGYFLNLKDQAAYPHLKQLLDLGVDSFKIEGRMKSEAYVYAVSRFYRSLITEYEKTGNILPPSKDQLDELKQLFNRGSFTDGYFLHKDHMIEPLTPKNQGLRIGRVKSVQGSRIQIESGYPMHAGDELEIDPSQKTGAYPAAVRLSASMLRSDRLAVFNFKDPHFHIAENDSVRRVVDPVLQNELSRKSAEPVPVPIRISGVLREGMPSQWKAVVRDHVMQIEGPAPERAEKTSLSKETIQAQMSRMGNSPFVLEGIYLEMDDNLFLPVSSLNQIRRQLTEGMEEILTSRPKISAAGGCPKKFADADPGRVSSDSLSTFEGCGAMQIVFEN
ncbi:MAG: U32 family peptidase, partial [Firmicutes bacterium]|nr:U32 family peptidase [Bacillota bacterium]